MGLITENSSYLLTIYLSSYVVSVHIYDLQVTYLLMSFLIWSGKKKNFEWILIGFADLDPY